MRDFLPICKKDMEKRGWKECDFVYVIGDAYVDHSSFGPAIISRVLESHGYRVGIIAQPDWTKDDSVAVLGKPRLGFLVSGGNIDSMVDHYTVAKKHRSYDYYTPGGVMGKRPDRCVTVYGNLIRHTFKDSPIIIGGIEASLRRLAHYDYWSDKVKRSVLLDSGADIISYGMGEHSVVEIADALNAGIPVKEITFVKGTVYKARNTENLTDFVMLPSYDEICSSKEVFAKSFYTQYQNTDPFQARTLVEKYKDYEFVVQNPPSMPLSMQEMDDVYDLPYMRNYHPSYEKDGGVPAINEIKYSLTSNRGCFGGCSFCALTFHQGRIVQARSHESIIREAEGFTKEKDFKGNISDVGGPTAQFRGPACEKQCTKGACMNRQCLWPEPCKNMKIDHSDYASLLRKLRAVPGVKRVFVRSGIRFDYLIADKNDDFFKDLCKYHISGQLRVAPEHISDGVLDLMGKPDNAVYERFVEKFARINGGLIRNGKLDHNQYVLPYLISSHPGSTLEDAIALAEYIRDLGYCPEQVQDFYPTPSTISTCMYYTGLDPRTMKKVYVPDSPREKAMQRALIQYRDPKNYDLVKEALIKAGRNDLIGFEKNCLIPPRKIEYGKKNEHGKKSESSKKPENGKKPVSKMTKKYAEVRGVKKNRK